MLAAWGFGIWNFLGIWSLGFGIFSFLHFRFARIGYLLSM
jgi:hypothetical protein